VRTVLDPLEELARIALEGALGQHAVDFQPGLVLRSHTSVVSVPRTARAFSRAARRQERMDEGLEPSRTMKSSTPSRVTVPWRAV
jgi:hypothetical protein